MSAAKYLLFIKKRGLAILLYAFLVVILVSPAAKSWVLQELVATGLFNASFDKSVPAKSNSANLSFDYLDNQGSIKNTASLRGKIVFINFWASWCPPCRAEMVSLNQLYLKLKNDDRIVFLFLNQDDDKTKAISYLREKAFTLPLYTPSGGVPEMIFKGTLPTTAILDKSGNVVFFHEGMRKYDTDTFIRQLKSLL
jgi:thiol-disulfide isomerase/thioredoxin